MKDREARAVINVLTERIKDLESVARNLEHPENCRCNYCNEYAPAIDLRTHLSFVKGKRYAEWWRR